MTKEKIVEALKTSAKPNETYYLDDEIEEAMMQYPEPIELVESVLEIIRTNPAVDFGMPGYLVHFVERFSRKGYEELLISSVKRNPTRHNIWMIHRCFNDKSNPFHDDFLELIKSIRNDPSTSDEIRNAIDDFTW